MQNEYLNLENLYPKEVLKAKLDQLEKYMAEGRFDKTPLIKYKRTQKIEALKTILNK